MINHHVAINHFYFFNFTELFIWLFRLFVRAFEGKENMDFLCAKNTLMILAKSLIAILSITTSICITIFLVNFSSKDKVFPEYKNIYFQENIVNWIYTFGKCCTYILFEYEIIAITISDCLRNAFFTLAKIVSCQSILK